MSYKLNAIAMAAAIGLGSGGGAAAADAEPSMYSFSGFGTLGVAHSSESQADFKLTLFQLNGAGHSSDWAYGVDSRLGGQVRADFNARWSAVVQVVAEQQWDGSYRPGLEWANVKYAATPDLSIRVGRIAMPTLLAEESIKVGYASPFVRQPLEVYSMQSVTNSDGVDVTYSFGNASLRNTVTAFAGKHKAKLGLPTPSPAETDITGLVGLLDTIKYGDLTVHLARQQLKFSIAAFGVFKLPYTLDELGASYDTGNWFVTGEMARTRIQVTPVVKRSAAYVMGGYRIGDFTPYLGIARSHASATNGIFATNGQKSATAGLRWDFTKNVDLKMQYERAWLDPNSVGTLSVTDPGFKTGGKFGVFSAVVDFVF